jgi:hypothetical protein
LVRLFERGVLVTGKMSLGPGKTVLCRNWHDR